MLHFLSTKISPFICTIKIHTTHCMPHSKKCVFIYFNQRKQLFLTLPSLRNTITSSSLCGIPYYLTYTNARRARCAPNKHYEIPFVRSIPCSSLCFYLVTNATSLHSGTNDDCIIPITYAIIKSIKEEPSTSASVRLISEE